MATQPMSEQPGRFVSVEEYLSTVYEPDCELFAKLDRIRACDGR